MKVIVSFSGGKDSLASLLWVRNNLTKDFITVFCDTGWEHPLTYKYIEEVQEQLGLNLITVKSKKFNGMVDLTKKKSRWPSSQRRFCTSELKTIPMIVMTMDYAENSLGKNWTHTYTPIITMMKRMIFVLIGSYLTMR